MNSTTTDGREFDPVTGEIIERHEMDGPTETVVNLPTSIVKGGELANLPESLGDLAAFFAEPEPTARDIVQWIAGTSEMEESDPEDTMRSIMARILGETTAEGILRAHQVIHAQDILNVAIEVTSVKWQRSRIEGGSTCYAVIAARLIDQQQDATITCSGRNVMTQLLAFQHHKVLPVRCRITKASKQTEAGYWPLWLEPA